MIRKSALLLAIILACVCAQTFAETVKVGDARMDKAADSDGFVLFISKRISASGAAGQAIIATGRGEAPDNIEIQAAFGMYLDSRKFKTGKVSPEIIAALRASDEGQTTMTYIARVNSDTYDTILAKMQNWEKGEDVTPGSPAAQVMETTRITLLTIKELKLPYTSGFSPDLQTYLEDLHILNRKK